MKKTILVAAALLVMLAGCANMAPQQADSASAGRKVNPFVDAFDPIRISFRALTRNPNKPVVSIDGGYIVIDQEPIYIVQNDTDNVILWTLDSTDYIFCDKRGIEFVAEGGHPKLTVKGCDRDASNLRLYSCKYDKAKPDKYFYKIRVTKDDKKCELESDPSVMNN